MTTPAKRTTRSFAAFVLALCLAASLTSCAYSALAATNGDEGTEATTSATEEADATETPTAAAETPATAAEAPTAAAETPATAAEIPTTATIMYYENVSYDDGDTEPDENGRVLLGSYELTDVHVGQTLNAWNYVVDIPGHFFWDGWPQNLTLTDNPSDNVINLFYFKLWNNEYTVNYYLMENADLTADNWKDALAPDDVKFVKMGSETFTDQRFDKLVKGDAYEYKIDGTYVVDTYPSEIRVGVNPDDNVINVLYVPDSANLPDDIEVPTDTTPPSDATQPDDTTPPDDSGNGDNSAAQPADGARRHRTRHMLFHQFHGFVSGGDVHAGGGVGFRVRIFHVTLFLSTPAVCADFIPVDADGLQQAVQGLVAQGVEAQRLADALEHTGPPLRGGVGVFVQMLLALVALQLLNRLPGQQLHV